MPAENETLREMSYGLTLAQPDLEKTPRSKFGNETISPERKPELIEDGILYQMVERFVALLIFLVLTPVMLLIYLRIRFGSPGPVIFVQERVGQGGKTFKFYKFRTMYADARERFPELYAYKYDDAALKELKFKVKDDPRVTPEGKWLRKASLDELPNFWNAVVGNLSLTGPRPEIPEMVPYYEGEMLRKFATRPGITGLAQIKGRGDLGFYETVDYDLQYVNNKSVLLDIKILIGTAISVLKRDGAF
ncbi:sugar transferase [Pelagicoccus sp. SDUM812005]|uniref:sugar transferase n=1 Tax=Pelagicoccus sp. SDUM812005 TaxID=3041257 RepID=UPI00280FEFD9|nr:sugar transferase [Pelagicoccus sp. SDUM812005]MDQ8180647.1 sugar transferase [Pelagicoccus sp. SDUM812005]